MIRTSKNQDSFFTIICSDWSITVKDKSHQQACAKALQKMLAKYGTALNISFFMSSERVSKKKEDIDIVETSSVLADLGYFNISKSLSEMRDFFLDKGKNPH